MVKSVKSFKAKSTKEDKKSIFVVQSSQGSPTCLLKKSIHVEPKSRKEPPVNRGSYEDFGGANKSVKSAPHASKPVNRNAYEKVGGPPPTDDEKRPTTDTHNRFPSIPQIEKEKDDFEEARQRRSRIRQQRRQRRQLKKQMLHQSVKVMGVMVGCVIILAAMVMIPQYLMILPEPIEILDLTADDD